MSFSKLSNEQHRILIELLAAKNPTQFLYEALNNDDKTETNNMRANLRELSKAGYINIQWAYDMPYIVKLNQTAKEYLALMDEQENDTVIRKFENNNIIIGNGNKITNSKISTNDKGISSNDSDINKSFFERHPIVCSFLISLAAGFILLFSFWSKIIDFIEGVF